MKKAFIQKLSIAMASALVITAAAPATADAAAKDMKINKTAKTLYLNEDNLTNTASVYDFNINKKPANYKTKYKFTWYEDSANGKSYVDVAAGGIVTAKKVGQTTIKCDIIKKSNGSLFKTVEATVTVKANAETVEIKNAPTEAMTVGTTFDFNRTMKAANGGSATDKTEWIVTADAEGKEATDVASIDKNGVVTALKAGSFYVWAKTYQSVATKDQGYTAVSEAVKVDVALNLTDIKLNKANTITLTYDSSVKELVKNPSDVEIQTVATNRVKYTPKTVTVSEDGKTVVVETYQNFVNDTTYAVTAAGSSKEFKAQIGTISSIVVENQVVPAVQNVKDAKTLPYTVYDEYGVDITAQYPYATPTSIGIEVNSSINGQSSVLQGGIMNMVKVGDQVSVQLTYAKYNPTTGADESVKSNIAIITCGETAIAATSKWTIADSAYPDKAYDKIVNTIAANDMSKKLFVTFKDNFGTDITDVKYESMNSDILEVTSDGMLLPFKQGTAIVKVTSGSYTDYLTIEVKAEAKFKEVVTDTTAYSLSNAKDAKDSKVVTFTLKDIYNEAYTKGDIATGVLTEISDNNDAVTVDGNTTVKDYPVTFNNKGEATVTFTPSSDARVGNATYKLTVNGTSTAYVSISVKAPTGATTFRLDADKTEIDNFDDNNKVLNVSVFHVDSANVLVAPADTKDFTWSVPGTKLGGDLSKGNVITIDAKNENLAAGTYTLEVNNGPVKKVLTFTVKSSKAAAQIVLNQNKVAAKADVNTTLQSICTFKLNGKDESANVTSANFKYYVLDNGTVSGGAFDFSKSQEARLRVYEVDFVVNGVTYTAPMVANITVTQF